MPDIAELFSADGRNLRPSAIRVFAKLINDPAIISFAGGVPSPETFPADLLAAFASRVIIEKRGISLQYGPTAGLPRLRESIARICGERGFIVPADEILVTTGSQQALNLIAHVLLDPGDVVLVELPTYIGATASFTGRRAELSGIASDADGIVIDSLIETASRLTKEGRRIKFLYTIPNFQNPSGRLMSQQRRVELLEAAESLGILIIEDDPYGELLFDETVDITPIKTLDRSGRVIYLGSFSKVLAPGLRCGYIAAGPVLHRQFEIAKEAADLCGGMLDQSIVDEFVAAGLLPAQIATVREFYKQRRDVMLSALSDEMTGIASWTDARGGLFTFLTLRDKVDTALLVPEAIRRGVAYVPGAPFFVDGSGAATMRLTFAKEPDHRMKEGVRRLAGLFTDSDVAHS